MKKEGVFLLLFVWSTSTALLTWKNNMNWKSILVGAGSSTIKASKHLHNNINNGAVYHPPKKLLVPPLPPPPPLYIVDGQQQRGNNSTPKHHWKHGTKGGNHNKNIRVVQLYDDDGWPDAYTDTDTATKGKSSRAVDPLGDLSSCCQEELYPFYQSRLSKEYDHGSDNCKPIVDWQKQSFPTCNEIHGIGFETLVQHVLGTGTLSTAFMIHEYDLETGNNDREMVFKTNRYDLGTTAVWSDEGTELDPSHDPKRDRYELPRVLDKTRIDALAMERLSSSPNIINGYGYCGQSILTEAGKMEFIDAFASKNQQQQRPPPQNNITSMQKLKWGIQAATILSEIHSIDAPKDKMPTLSHGDFGRSNLLITADGRLVGNDFNQGYLLHYTATTNAATNTDSQQQRDQQLLCSNQNEGNRGSRQSSRPPERFAQNGYTRGDKNDVYALGILLIEMLLGQEQPFRKQYYKMKTESQQNQRCLKVPYEIYDSHDTAVSALLYAGLACMSYKAENRPTAYLISEGLQQVLKWIEDDDETELKAPYNTKELFVVQDERSSFAGMKAKNKSTGEWDAWNCYDVNEVRKIDEPANKY